ncbi:MAG: polysaccharide deacetylase family protein [Planctomycetales bacterium]|nr:polysaccharide deacetylase family protein [Planctomycetales bacterium]
MRSPGDLTQSLINYAPVPLRATLPNCATEAFSILMYHRVCPNYKGLPRCPWGVTPRQLSEQLAGLLEMGYEAWPLNRVLEYRQKNKPVPSNAFVVTFDDGYANNLHWGLPVLKELNVPATVFVVTSMLDRYEPYPSDEWQMAGSSRVPAKTWVSLTSDQAKQLLDSGLVQLGAHTHTHVNLAETPQVTEVEIFTSLVELSERFDLQHIPFAFPYGGVPENFDDAMIARLRNAGMTCALTTQEAPVGPGQSPFAWGRFTAHRTDTATTLAAKLDGHYTLLRDAWRKVRGQ